MSVSIDELTTIYRNARYARFIRANLHLHTPVTPQDWNSRPNQTTRAEDITPEKYFGELNKTSLELVAITDHNTIKWCEPLMRLAREERKRGRSKIHILPGVEITTYEGPHIIAIFEENMSLLGEIKKFLDKLELSGEGGPDERVSKGLAKPITIHDLFEMITNPKLGGLIVAPHIQNEDGIWGARAFRSRPDILNNHKLRILSAPSGDIKRVAEGNKIRLLYKNMPSQEITNSFGFINIADCHRLEDFEENNTWIKMSEPSLDGVRQIIYEPELRVSHRLTNSYKPVENPVSFEFTSPEMVHYPYIIGLGITGGLLDGQVVVFSPHQNSIIGKNYSGKSALLDCLRFALDALPKQDDEAFQKLIARLKGILTDGGQVRVYISGKDEKIYGISRTLSTTKKRNGWLIEGEPDIFSLINEEFRHDTDLSIREIFDLEIYAQGEVVRIKDNVAKQMTIVDTLAKVDKELYELRDQGTEDNPTLLGNLCKSSEEIIGLEAQCEEWSEEVNGIDGLNSEIKSLEALARSTKLKRLSDWTDLENNIHTYIEQLDDFRDEIASLKRKLPAVAKRKTKAKSIKPKKGAIIDYSQQAKTTFDEAINKMSDALDDIGIRHALEELRKLEGDCHTKADEIISKFKGGLKGSSDRTQLVERIAGKKRRLANLRAKERKINEAQTRISTLETERQTLRNNLQSKWMEVRRARQVIVDLINQKSAENIHAELDESVDREKFRENLGIIADHLSSASNKISNKQNQLDLVVDRFTPDDFIALIKAKDIDALIRQCSITENTAKILMGMGKGDIHLLESTLLEDKFLIKYQREGEDTFTPIDAGLSGGEQALALVSVAMIPKNLPLVIDQPEDELGTSLITNKLVEQIRGVKLERQLIFVTHIANIPVLADSEQVIYMLYTYQDGNKAANAKYQGSLDYKYIIECLMELDGGKFAFKKRSERYSALMINEGWKF